MKINNLVVIDEREVLGKQFRIYGDFENPLWLASDVANWIEHSNVSKMIEDANLSEAETTKKSIDITYSYGNGFRTRSQESLFLTEDGLYEVLMQSRKPIAKQFKTKVKEILKSIRKNGMYATEITLEKMISDPSFAIQLLTKLKEEQDKRKELEQKVEQDKPKVEYHDNVLNTDTCYTTTQIAKELEMSARQLNTLLYHMGVQFKQSGQWLLTSKYQDKGYVRTRTNWFTDSKGGGRTRHYTVWTEKGREFLIDLSEDF